METLPKMKGGALWPGRDAAPRAPGDFPGLADLAASACSRSVLRAERRPAHRVEVAQLWYGEVQVGVGMHVPLEQKSGPTLSR